MLDSALTNSIDAQFLTLTDEFQQFMISVKKKCEEFDQGGDNSARKQIGFINSCRPIFVKIDNFFDRLNDISKDFSRERHILHRKYFQGKLLDFFIIDTLNERIYKKPLGYAGDYGIMNYMYEDGYPGNSTFAKLVNRYTLSVSLAKSHIARRPYFKNLIIDTIEKNKNNSDVRISSFACGTAIEILDVFKEYPVPSNVTFFGVDGEPRAIAQINDNISNMQKITGRATPIILRNENVLNMVRRKVVLPELENQDLIYCAGFFDYLSEKTTKALFHYLFGFLKKGGILVGVNIFKEHSCGVYLEMIGEWYMEHRDEKDMLKLAEGLPSSEVTIDFDPVAKTNIYIVVRK